jgi:hypothetical protein
MEKYPILLPTLVASLVALGGLHYCSSITDQPERVPAIENSFNSIINIGATAAQLDPTLVEAVVQEAAGRRDVLAREAIEFVRPAKRGGGGDVSFGESVRLDRAAVEAFPEEYQPPKREEAEPLGRVQVELRAIDLDSGRRGWAGVIPTISEERKKIIMLAEADPTELLRRRRFEARAEAIYEVMPSGERKLRRYQILQVLD